VAAALELDEDVGFFNSSEVASLKAVINRREIKII
jgi:hypothetical protein